MWCFLLRGGETRVSDRSDGTPSFRPETLDALGFERWSARVLGEKVEHESLRKKHMKKALIVGLIAPVMSIALVATPALASHWSSDDISVSNTNSAYVKNNVNVSADTGGNTAN